MSRPFHAKAWLAWLAASSSVIIAVDNPATTLVAVSALILVATSFGSRGPEGRSYAVLLKLGLAFLFLRTILFGLTGHTGETTLFTLPQAGLPAVLGGFSIGGSVTAEVLAQSAAEGLKIAAFLACFGVFLSVVETYRVLRLLPRFLFEAGLVVGIALGFIPAMLRAAAEIRDAQRLRGHRFRGIGSLRPLVVPLLAGALERSLTLAASMESRGYGRAAPGHARTEARARTAVLLALLAITGGAGLALAGLRFPGLALAGVAVVVLAFALRTLSTAVPRTRFTAERIGAWDAALGVGSAVMVALAFASRGLGSAHWYAYPTVDWPALDVRLVALAACLALPVPLAALRAARMRRASERHPATEAIHAGAHP